MNQMSCSKFRDRATAGERDPDLDAHRDACADCNRFSERLDAAREILSERIDVEPDPGFSVRVIDALPRTQTDELGLAALRILPAACALLLVLTAWTWQSTPTPDALIAEALSEPTIDLLLLPEILPEIQPETQP